MLNVEMLESKTAWEIIEAGVVGGVNATDEEITEENLREKLATMFPREVFTLCVESLSPPLDTDELFDLAETLVLAELPHPSATCASRPSSLHL
jgi:hypothetical protein